MNGTISCPNCGAEAFANAGSNGERYYRCGSVVNTAGIFAVKTPGCMLTAMDAENTTLRRRLEEIQTAASTLPYGDLIAEFKAAVNPDIQVTTRPPNDLTRDLLAAVLDLRERLAAANVECDGMAVQRDDAFRGWKEAERQFEEVNSRNLELVADLKAAEAVKGA